MTITLYAQGYGAYCNLQVEDYSLVHITKTSKAELKYKYGEVSPYNWANPQYSGTMSTESELELDVKNYNVFGVVLAGAGGSNVDGYATITLSK